MSLFASQFTSEEIQAVNEMKRLVLDKVSLSPFPFNTEEEINTLKDSENKKKSTSTSVRWLQ